VNDVDEVNQRQIGLTHSVIDNSLLTNGVNSTVRVLAIFTISRNPCVIANLMAIETDCANFVRNLLTKFDLLYFTK